MAEQNKLTAEEAKDFRAQVMAEMFDESPGKPAEDFEQEPEIIEPEREEKPVDPLAELKQMVEGISGRLGALDTIANRLQQAEKRIGGITNDLHAAKVAAQEAKKTQTEAPTQAEIDKAARDSETWAGLKEEFPEWAEAMDVRLAAERAELEKKIQGISGASERIAQLEAQLEAMEKKRVPEEKLEYLEQKIKLEIAHPGWEATVETPEWHAWKAIQTDDVKAKMASSKAKDAIAVLDLYAASKKTKTASEIAEERRRRLSTAQLPSGTRRQPQKSEADMTNEEYRNQIAARTWAD